MVMVLTTSILDNYIQLITIATMSLVSITGTIHLTDLLSNDHAKDIRSVLVNY